MTYRGWFGWSLTAALALGLFAPVATAQEPKVEEKKSDEKKDEWKETKSGLKYKDTKEGTGATPEDGQTCKVHYTGWLWEDGKKGEKFDSSVDRGKPFSFAIGQKKVIKGWDEGVATMKVGGKRTLQIPPDLAYGKRGAGGVIPPDATLLFEVELLGVE